MQLIDSVHNVVYASALVPSDLLPLNDVRFHSGFERLFSAFLTVKIIIIFIFFIAKAPPSIQHRSPQIF